ncbi:MAG: hypothetical protein JWL90_1695, partial [Chthoniobacteraceae bacterium]|nr:hypothetical protein [Chthoniobacteraceae bacterium]
MLPPPVNALRALGAFCLIWLSAINLNAQVVINEIHYKPLDPTKAIEFIELYNAGTTAADIGFWRLEDAVTLIFPSALTIPAGGYLVVAGNAPAFQTQYGFAPAAVYSGSLNSSGERIQLRSASGQIVDKVDYSSGFPWPTSARGGGFSIELINPLLDNELGASWRSSTVSNGTPRVKNSVIAANAPPAIRQVEHFPLQPPSGAVVTITAKVSDPDGVASVNLEYQIVSPGAYIRKTDAAFATSWVATPMHDDGLNGDTAASDGIYSVQIPATVQTHRRLIRYRIAVADSLGLSVRVPYADDEQPNFAYYVYDGVPAWSGAVLPGGTGTRALVQTFSPALLNSIQTWQLISNSADVINSQYSNGFDSVRFLGTLIYEGKVYDHIQYHNRGIGSTYVSGKNKWVFFFNRARDIRVRDNWGNYYKESWNSMPMDACASPWAAVHRGMAGVEEAFAYRLYELAGMASLRTHYMHFRVVSGATETGATQYDGDFWGLYMGLEPTEGNFLDERGLADGNIYAVEGGGGDKKHQGPTQVVSAADFAAFNSSAKQVGQTEAWYRANIDLNALYTFHALNRLCGNVDVRGGDNYRFYHRPTDDRWAIIPYDLDMMALPAYHWGTVIEGVNFAGVPDQIRAITRNAAIAIEFRNRARELLDLVASDNTANGGQIGQLLDEYARMVNPSGVNPSWVNVDEARWSNSPRTAGNGANNGQTNHKNNFYRAIFTDTRGGLNGTPSTTWTRTLINADANGYSNFAGSMNYLLKFTTNAWPGGTWLRSNGNPLGNGYKYLEWESLYGGYGNVNAAPTGAGDLSFPGTPTIAYSGVAGFPADALDFTSSAFTASTTGGTTFAAMQWRIGEIYAPGVAGYLPGEQRIYEVEQAWTSPEVASFSATARVPFGSVKPGHTYRARVRHKDANGRWSHWSAPVQFSAGIPSVTAYQQALVISEVMYQPSPATASELSQGWTDDDFEFIEIRNVGGAVLDMGGLRLTKGVDFDFPSPFLLQPGASTLVVHNAAAFNSRYGAGKPIAGVWQAGNKLSDDGEQIKLSYGAGTEVISFTYSNVSPWPVDTAGYSLVLSRPETNLGSMAQDDPVNWRISRLAGGSPGSDDRPLFASWLAASGAGGDELSDPQGDGVVNLLEYAFAGGPSVPSQSLLPLSGTQRFLVNGISSDYLTLTFQRQFGAEDIEFHVEFTNDIGGGAWLQNGVLV